MCLHKPLMDCIVYLTLMKEKKIDALHSSQVRAAVQLISKKLNAYDRLIVVQINFNET